MSEFTQGTGLNTHQNKGSNGLAEAAKRKLNPGINPPNPFAKGDGKVPNPTGRGFPKPRQVAPVKMERGQ